MVPLVVVLAAQFARGLALRGADPVGPVEAHVGAAPGDRHVVAAGRRRLPVEGDVAQRDRRTRFCTEPHELLFDAEPVQPVGEIADGLVVVELGLPDPPLGPLAADDEATGTCGSGTTVNSAASTALGRITARRASCFGFASRYSRTSFANAKASSRRPSRLTAETRYTGHPNFSRSGCTMSASSAASGMSILLRTMIRGTPGEVAEAEIVVECRLIGREFSLEGLDVGHRVTVGLQRRTVDDVGQHRAALDVAQEVQPGPRPPTRLE